jgi:arylsulfatase A-like enzyme
MELTAAVKIAAISLLILHLVAASAPGGKKNVLFIAVDDLRPELNTYGYDFIKSPHIDRLASKSIQFDRAYCQIAICSPSRASLLTGRRPDTNHVWWIAADEYWRTVPDATNATTIPQYFKNNGYISIGMGKIFHPGAPSGHDDDMYSWSPEGLPYFHAREDDSIAKHAAWYDFKLPDNKLRDGMIAENAISVLQSLKANKTNGDDRPFFLAVGFHKPHLPFYCSSEYFKLYPDVSQIPLPANPDAPKDMPYISYSVWRELKSYSDIKVLFNGTDCYDVPDLTVHAAKCHLPDDKIRELRRAYYSCVSYTDSQIGKVVMELEKQGYSEDTVIVLWADHGWQLGEHNEWSKHTNFEDATRVPFIIHVPGVTDKGMHSNALVELIDIFPTITEAAGIDKPPLCSEKSPTSIACVEGYSLMPLLTDPNREWKKGAFSQYPRPDDGFTQIPGKPPFDSKEHGESVMGYTIRVDKYRFTEWYKFDRTTSTPNFNDVWGSELYDHSQPNTFFNDENVNMANDPDMAETVNELRKMLQAGWRAALPS